MKICSKLRTDFYLSAGENTFTFSFPGHWAETSGARPSPELYTIVRPNEIGIKVAKHVLAPFDQRLGPRTSVIVPER